MYNYARKSFFTLKKDKELVISRCILTKTCNPKGKTYSQDIQMRFIVWVLNNNVSHKNKNKNV